jgi:hypothetical protein
MAAASPWPATRGIAGVFSSQDRALCPVADCLSPSDRVVTLLGEMGCHGAPGGKPKQRWRQRPSPHGSHAGGKPRDTWVSTMEPCVRSLGPRAGCTLPCCWRSAQAAPWRPARPAWSCPRRGRQRGPGENKGAGRASRPGGAGSQQPRCAPHAMGEGLARSVSGNGVGISTRRWQACVRQAYVRQG